MNFSETFRSDLILLYKDLENGKWRTGTALFLSRFIARIRQAYLFSTINQVGNLKFSAHNSKYREDAVFADGTLPVYQSANGDLIAKGSIQFYDQMETREATYIFT